MIAYMYLQISMEEKQQLGKTRKKLLNIDG